jgi:hypothetical protein
MLVVVPEVDLLVGIPLGRMRAGLHALDKGLAHLGIAHAVLLSVDDADGLVNLGRLGRIIDEVGHAQERDAGADANLGRVGLRVRWMGEKQRYKSAQDLPASHAGLPSRDVPWNSASTSGWSLTRPVTRWIMGSEGAIEFRPRPTAWTIGCGTASLPPCGVGRWKGGQSAETSRAWQRSSIRADTKVGRNRVDGLWSELSGQTQTLRLVMATSTHKDLRVRLGRGRLVGREATPEASFVLAFL